MSWALGPWYIYGWLTDLHTFYYVLSCAFLRAPPGLGLSNWGLAASRMRPNIKCAQLISLSICLPMRNFFSLCRTLQYVSCHAVHLDRLRRVCPNFFSCLSVQWVCRPLCPVFENFLVDFSFLSCCRICVFFCIAFAGIILLAALVHSIRVLADETYVSNAPHGLWDRRCVQAGSILCLFICLFIHYMSSVCFSLRQDCGYVTFMQRSDKCCEHFFTVWMSACLEPCSMYCMCNLLG